MNIQKFQFNEELIEFDLRQGKNMMVNATEMAKVFGRDLFQFTKSENTKSFIESCNKPAFAGLLGINSEEDLMSKFKSSVGYITDVYLQDISDTKPIYDEGLYPDKIPLRYIAKVDAEKKSNDLGRSLLKFAHFVNSYKHMNEVLPYTKLLKGQLADSKMVNNLNPKVEIQGNNSNAYVILDKFIEMQVLGRKKNVELVNTPADLS